MRISQRFIAVTIAAAVAFSVVPAIAQAQEKDDEHHQQVREIAKEVVAEIRDMPDYGAFDWINPRLLEGGTVMLTGSVARARLKTDITGVVEKIDGVNNVINNLIVLNESRADRETRVRVYNSIYRTYLSDYSPYLPGQGPMGATDSHGGAHPIHILVSDGQVALMGWVNSEVDKQTATLATERTAGVSKVENQLVVVPDTNQ